MRNHPHDLALYREIFSKSYQLKSDCINHFSIDLIPNERPQCCDVLLKPFGIINSGVVTLVRRANLRRVTSPPPNPPEPPLPPYITPLCGTEGFEGGSHLAPHHAERCELLDSLYIIYIYRDREYILYLYIYLCNIYMYMLSA